MRALALALLACVVLEAASQGRALAQAADSKLGILFGTSPPESKSLLIKDASGQLLDKFQWAKGLPAYVEFFLPAQRYNINTPGPIRSIEIETSSDAQTFLQYLPVTLEGGRQGVQITSWRGEPGPTITKAISELREARIGLVVVKWDLPSNGKTILFSTDPPWPNPFGNPRPPPPPPPKE
jgi:hypothetical protein